jgi:hypothetical protein
MRGIVLRARGRCARSFLGRSTGFHGASNVAGLRPVLPDSTRLRERLLKSAAAVVAEQVGYSPSPGGLLVFLIAAAGVARSGRPPR